jgi:L-lactate dehydrogenase complex protein LldG
MLCDVACVNDSNDVPSIVADYFSRHKLPARAVIGPTLSNLSWQAAGLDAQVRPVRDTDEAGVTPVFCAIAETATLMLLSRPETPASLSLLPETHVAIVEKRQLVGTMEDAWQKLRAEHGVLPRAVNFVSGPSRTADIEQTVTLGAHGPYRVLIVLVGA